MQKVAELVSLGLSVTTIVLCFSVVIFWSKSAKHAIKKKKRDPLDWFILGVFFGFIGESFDNLYWIFPWTFMYLEDEYLSSILMSHGVFSNIPFRQIMGSVSAYFHIRAHIEFSKSKDNKHNEILLHAIFIGLLYSIMLILNKTF
jgi:hypothetical protein